MRAIDATGFGRVTSVLLPKESKNIQEASSHGLFVTPELDALQVDAVIIATHPTSASHFCEYFIRRGTPVMVEKPVVLNIEDGRKIVDAVTATNTVFLVAHQHLFSHAYECIRDGTRDEKIISVATQAGGDGPYRDYSALLDYGHHDISMIFGLVMSEPSRVALSCPSPDGHFYFQLESWFPSGVRASSRIWNDRLPKTRLLTVQTEKSVWIYDDLDQLGRLNRNGKYLNIEYEAPLTKALRCFLKAVTLGETNDYRFGVDWVLKLPQWLAMSQTGKIT